MNYCRVQCGAAGYSEVYRYSTVRYSRVHHGIMPYRGGLRSILGHQYTPSTTDERRASIVPAQYVQYPRGTVPAVQYSVVPERAVPEAALRGPKAPAR